MKWKEPPEAKIYEALGAVADGRVKVMGNTARVTSSSGNKAYDVSYDAATAAVMANDNGSYHQGYLGYPAIAYLMQAGVLSYDPAIAETLKGIAWKDLNQRFKNDFDAAISHIMKEKPEPERALIDSEVKKIAARLTELDLNLLGPKQRPPEGY